MKLTMAPEDAATVRAIARLPHLTHTRLHFECMSWPTGLISLSAVQPLDVLDLSLSHLNTLVAPDDLSALLAALGHTPPARFVMCWRRDTNDDDVVLECLARLKNLDSLSLTNEHVTRTSKKKSESVEDSIARSLASFRDEQCLRLRSIHLQGVQLTLETFVAIAAATPNVREFAITENKVLDCHPAVLSLVIGHHWLHVTTFRCPSQYCRRRYKRVALREFNAAKKRFPQHPRSFEQLHDLVLGVCRACMTPELWFRFLHLFRRAALTSVRAIIDLPDDVSVMALSQLPRMRLLARDCQVPEWIRELYFDARDSRMKQAGKMKEQVIANRCTESRPANNGTTDDIHYYSIPLQHAVHRSRALCCVAIAPKEFLCMATRGVDGRAQFIAAIHERLSPADQAVVQRCQSLSDE